MGWLNTFVNAASAGANLAQLSKLQALEQQGADAAMIQAVLQALRSQIFEYSQAAKQVLAVEKQNPKLAAGGMRVLQLRIEDSGIRPDMFPDLQDKEYVADTYRLVKENDSRLIQQLSKEVQAEVTTAAESAGNLSRYDYYLTHFDAAQEYKEALPIYEKYKGRDSCLFRTGLGLFGMFVVPVFLFGFTLMIGDFMGEQIAGTLSCVALLVWGAILFGIFKLNNVSAFQKAKKIVQKHEDSSFDFKRFVELEAEFGTDKSAVSHLKDQAEKIVGDFFQGTQFLS